MRKIGLSYMEEADTQSGGGADERDYDAEAAGLGHVPKDKWKGDPAKWVDAKTFVERGEHILPIVLEREKRLRTELQVMQAAQAEMEADVAGFKKLIANQSAREKAELVAKYEAALEEVAAAVTSGDGEAFKVAQKKANTIKDAADAASEPATTDGDTTKKHPDYAGFVAANPWYENDEDLQEEANVYAAQIMRKHFVATKKHLLGKALYDKVVEKMLTKHPELGNEDTQGQAVVDDTSPSDEANKRGPKKGGRSYDNLPADAKKACESYIKRGWFDDKKYKTVDAKRAAYAADYQWD